MIELHGWIERELDGRILFRVAPQHGDAAAVGFRAKSAFWIKRCQCHVREARLSGELDRIQLSLELATVKAQLATSPEVCDAG